MILAGSSFSLCACLFASSSPTAETHTPIPSVDSLDARESKMAVIDIVTVPVRSGTNVLDPTTPKAKAFAESMQILGRQEGFIEAWYGYRVEDATKLMLFMSESDARQSGIG